MKNADVEIRLSEPFSEGTWVSVTSDFRPPPDAIVAVGRHTLRAIARHERTRTERVSFAMLASRPQYWRNLDALAVRVKAGDPGKIVSADEFGRDFVGEESPGA